MLLTNNFAHRVNLSLTALAFSVLLIVASVSYYAMRELMLHNLENNLKHTADLIARQLYIELNTLLETAHTIASNSLVANAIVDNEGRQRYLSNFLKNFSVIANVQTGLAVTDFQGAVYEKSHEFELLIAPKRIAEAVEENRMVTHCEESQAKRYMIVVVPVIFTNTGLPEGALVMQISLSEILIHHQIDDILAIQEEFKHTRPSIQLHVNTPCGKYFSIYRNNIDYHPNLSVSVVLPLIKELKNWHFNIELETHTRLFSKPLQQLLLIYLLLGALLLIIVMGLSHFLAFSLTRRLQALEQNAQKLAQTQPLGGRLDDSGEDEVARLASAFNHVLSHLEEAYEKQEEAKAAEAANRAKSAFIANMSHELRTPLNAILGFAQILSQDTRMPEKQRHQADNIKRGGDYLLSLINDVLDVAKIEAGRFELSPENWRTDVFFEGLEEIFNIRAKQKNIAFHYKPLNTLPAIVNCDEKRLRQIVMNLLGNAIKFTDHGQVTLRVGMAGNNLIIEVADTGIGIAPAHLETIFMPFNQVSDHLHKQQGSGLGLSITRKLVEAMEGELTLTSTLRQGSCFHLCIPVKIVVDKLEAEASRPSVNAYQRQDGAQTPFTLLIVDDIADSREILRAPLQKLGFTVIEAQDGEVAIDCIKHHPIDLILMDLRMPKLDGFATTKRLRNTDKFARIPIIAVSASTFEEDRQQTEAVGCDDFLAKPVHFEQLLRVLSQHLPLSWQYTKPSPPADECGTSLTEAQREDLLKILQQGHIGKLIENLEKIEELSECSGEIKELLALAQSFELNALQRRLQVTQA